ncbi:DUF1128 family protein, partial [Bacillus altitudinis]
MNEVIEEIWEKVNMVNIGVMKAEELSGDKYEDIE